jgi:hypothetical protein
MLAVGVVAPKPDRPYLGRFEASGAGEAAGSAKTCPGKIRFGSAIWSRFA